MLLALIIGCASQGVDDTATIAESSVLEASPLVQDLVRVHQEVFDQLVLFTISEADCEYPYFDGFGPEEFESTADAYPYPDIEGILSMTVEMNEDAADDLWGLDTTYRAVAAGNGLSEEPRPVWDGNGAWTIKAPGRNHTLRLSLAIDGAPAVDVALDFGIEDYIATGYRFGVVGTVDGEPVDTNVETMNPCPGDG